MSRRRTPRPRRSSSRSAPRGRGRRGPSRRSVLRNGLGLGAGLGLGGLGFGGLGCAPGRSWGTPHDERQAELLLPAAARPEGVFELYLYGGYAAWDTFYCVPELGHPDSGGEYAGTGWWLFQQGPDNIPEIFAGCGGGGRELLMPFGTDSLGRQVFLGPWVYPLRERPDILDRMRIMVMRHNQVPHQGGNPMSLTGHRFGSPRMAGTAAHIQRYFAEQDPTGRTAPHSYVLFPRNRAVTANNGSAAASIGLHRASARPLTVWLEEGPTLPETLRREILADRAGAVDDAIAYYRRGYEARLSTGSGLVRAPHVEDYAFARRSISEAPGLARLLTRELLTLGVGDRCGEFSDNDVSSTGIQLATRLLTDPQTPARYVISLDGGFLGATGGAGYDTHQFHVRESARNVIHAMENLVAQINEPGENDPNKLDLDRHTILITSEFGRTPIAENIDGGLDHWPLGYVQVAIGGWVDRDRAGVVGAIGEDGVAIDYFHPSELRSAMLMSMGIWPFTDESFAVGNVSTGSTEEDTAAWLREELLGYRLG